jgi:hypothetical protein
MTSMNMRMKRVADTKRKKAGIMAKTDPDWMAAPIVLSKKTLASWLWARERAHRRR